MRVILKEIIKDEIFENVFIDDSTKEFLVYDNCNFDNCVLKLPIDAFISFTNCKYSNNKFIRNGKIFNSMYGEYKNDYNN